MRFLDVCKAIGDVHGRDNVNNILGEALAYNCIGVDY
jgi:hypothetical protein